jgi:hypothetical protein
MAQFNPIFDVVSPNGAASVRASLLARETPVHREARPRSNRAIARRTEGTTRWQSWVKGMSIGVGFSLLLHCVALAAAPEADIPGTPPSIVATASAEPADDLVIDNASDVSP